jgi:hypothetical protein
MLRMRRELASLGHRDDAMLEAVERADQLLDEGDMASAETWHRILDERAKVPSEGKGVLERLRILPIGRCASLRSS